MLTPNTVENLHITSDSPNYSCPLVCAGVGYRTPFSPKNPPVSGPVQFKPGLFKGQLYLKKSPERVKAHGKQQHFCNLLKLLWSQRLGAGRWDAGRALGGKRPPVLGQCHSSWQDATHLGIWQIPLKGGGDKAAQQILL